MVGVYDCPLIHFGDVLCILDLIHEINNERVANSQPVIEAFDFGPRFLAGMSFKHDNAAAYGLTWFPCKLDVVQRGFYMIILKAFMKARAMKLSLLFDENKAFRRFLFRVPNVPFAVPCFLDALHRYVEILSKGSVRNHERKQAIFDMLKPVRLNIEEDFHRDWPNWYQYNMDSDVLFCCSCGYEALQDFFTAHSRDVQLPHQRVCAGCILQRYLDKEICRAFPEKNAALDSLFPRWDGLKVNKPAPILKGTKVLHLKTIKNQRPQEPVLRMLENGRLESPQSQRALVVDGKVHWDSLEGLTALNCLADGLEGVGWRWGHFLNQCHQIDIVFRTTRLLMDSRSDLSPAEICLLGQLCPTGKQDHAEELQCGRDKAQGQMSHTFVTALSKHCLLAKDEWMPSLDGKGKTVSGVCDEAAGREFW
jgi:hypothetical protein